MLKSMTAYSQFQKTTKAAQYSLEIQSLNRKHLDINLNLSSEFTPFDADIRKVISALLSRGQINLKLVAAFHEESPLFVTPNIALGKQIYSACQSLAEKLNVPFNPAELWSIFGRQPQIFVFENNAIEKETYKKEVLDFIKEGLEQLCQMREKEGAILQKDIKKSLEILLNIIHSIEQNAPKSVEKIRTKLFATLKNIGVEQDQDRILREVVLYAEKLDINEEIIRLKSHIKQFHFYIDTAKEAIGKKLEFLIQEMHREINTIGSKSADVDISKSVVEAKTEIEKIREQLQNIE